MFFPTDLQKQQALGLIESHLSDAKQEVNDFCSHVFLTRGGRIGSGMGGILEALWGYYINRILASKNQAEFELAWFPEHQYHDFACVHKSTEWNPETKEGEFFRIEVKSMNTGADESKAHFDVLLKELDESDALLVLIWEWKAIDEFHFFPEIIDSFFSLAKPIAMLRDELHIARGGCFVSANDCPDGCLPDDCTHSGEPLNASGKRERLSGPKSCRPSQASYAANFGGLVRMLKTQQSKARSTLRRLRKEHETADKYVAFIHHHFPNEEKNHYTIAEWRQLADRLALNYQGMSKDEIFSIIRMDYPHYFRILKDIF